VTILDDPNNRGLRIDSMWVFISCDETGEGVCAAPLMGPGSLIPMIAADEARLQSLLPIARAIAAQTNKTIKLVRFTTREEIQTIIPGRPQ